MIRDFSDVLKNEEGLDPQDWQKHKAIAHQMIDDAYDFLATIKEQPVWRKPTQAMKDHFNAGLPQNGQDLDTIYEEFQSYILPYYTGNIHPKFFSWVHGSGTITGALAEMLAATINANLAVGDHGAIYVENNVLNWCKQIVGYDQDSSGVLLNGASMANTSSLIVAKNAFIKQNANDIDLTKLVIYCSTETHNCIVKGVKAIGLNKDNIHYLPVDENFKMDLAVLQKKIEADKINGLIPFCVVANAGTVNTGAIDPFLALHSICRDQGLWLHIDGAIGAVLKMLPEFQDEMNGLELADSIAFDLHKWLHINYECGCMLIRKKELHRQAFANETNYLFKHERGLAAGPDSFSNYSLDLSKSFKSLKVWFNLKENGIEKYKRIIRQNIAQAAYLAEEIKNNSSFRLMAPVNLNIVCFQYYVPELTDTELNKLNMEIVMNIQEQGMGAPSYTIINGNYVIRICINNHRTRIKDLKELMQEILLIGDSIVVVS